MTEERFEEIQKQLHAIADEVEDEGGAIIFGVTPDRGNNSATYTRIGGYHPFMGFIVTLLTRRVSDEFIKNTVKK
jgi:hypothetical protein